MTTEPTRRMPDALGSAMTMVGPALRDSVERHLGEETDRVAQYHHGWIDATGRPTDAWSGKLLRPSLALLSTRAAGRPAASGVPAAVAIEFVHNFSLLHDDIMDGDTARRGRATAWTLFGIPQAILTGDALLTAAVAVLLDTEEPGARTAVLTLMRSTQRMISGQAADVEFERRGDVTLDECVRMAGDKTGALLSCACAMGAELVGADADLAARLEGFGEHLGMAFQLVDDLLGIWGDPEVTGKQVRADLRVRKKSLPVVAALNAPGSDELAALYLRPDPLDEREVQHVADLVERAGGRDWAQETADRHLAAARQCLADASLDDAVRDDFLEITEFLTGRRF